MAMVTGSERQLGNVHGAQPQLSPCAFQAHAPDIAGNILGHTGCEDAMEMRDGVTGDGRQHFAFERSVGVRADIMPDLGETFVIAVRALQAGHRVQIILHQNASSLLQKYHPVVLYRPGVVN